MRWMCASIYFSIHFPCWVVSHRRRRLRSNKAMFLQSEVNFLRCCRANKDSTNRVSRNASQRNTTTNQQCHSTDIGCHSTVRTQYKWIKQNKNLEVAVPQHTFMDEIFFSRIRKIVNISCGEVWTNSIVPPTCFLPKHIIVHLQVEVHPIQVKRKKAYRLIFQVSHDSMGFTVFIWKEEKKCKPAL